MTATRFDLSGRIGPAVAQHRLEATPAACVWGYIDRDTPAVLEVDAGDIIEIEAITHHAGDAPDLLMDDGIRSIWAGIEESDHGPGVHVLTGPIAVRGARPGDTLMVRILDMHPRLPFGSNCAANWGLLYDEFAKERITIYELVDPGAPSGATFGKLAEPRFAYDFTTRPRVRHAWGRHTAGSRNPTGFQPCGSCPRSTALRRDGGGACGTWSPLKHSAGRVRRQRRQLANRPRRDRVLPGVR